MITIREIITVSRDEPMFKEFEKQFADWHKEECTVSVTWTRVQYIGAERKEE